jgi:hypothetical protein
MLRRVRRCLNLKRLSRLIATSLLLPFFDVLIGSSFAQRSFRLRQPVPERIEPNHETDTIQLFYQVSEHRSVSNTPLAASDNSVDH